MDHRRVKEISPEVLYADGGFVSADNEIIGLLKTKASTSPRHRCRLCFHPNSDAAQQEMLIVMHKSSYVRPHRHFGKSETLMVIEGAAKALVFDEDGGISETVEMSAPNAGKQFFYRMPEAIFHTLIFQSEWFVFLETTVGPFDPTQSEGAPWAPEEADAKAGHAFLRSLRT